MDKFEAEYRAKLTPAQFHILRKKEPNRLSPAVII